jgi:hypothetical protein
VTTTPLGPDDPLLFFPEGWETRWWSVGDVERRIAGAGRALGALDLHPGATVAHAASHRPEALVADLAIRRAGFVPAPRAPEADARLLLPGEEVEVTGPVARLPELADCPTEISDKPFSVPISEVVYPDGSRDSAARASARVAALAEAFHGPRRPIALGVADPGDPDRRAFLDAALVAGAALILEFDAEFLAGSALWARPTVIAVLAGEERVLSNALARADRRARKRLFARLDTLVLLGDARLGLDALAEWSEAGVRVFRPGGV